MIDRSVVEWIIANHAEVAFAFDRSGAYEWNDGFNVEIPRATFQWCCALERTIATEKHFEHGCALSQQTVQQCGDWAKDFTGRSRVEEFSSTSLLHSSR